MKKPFDTLGQYGRFGADTKASLRDPATKAAFLSQMSAETDAALTDPILLQGQRAEAMFEALVISLGEVMMIKREDVGHFHTTAPMIAPDFRLLLPDGGQWLVEVKNVYEPDPFDQRRELMDAKYLGKQQAYAQATGAELKIAVYWARWGIWTLSSPTPFVRSDGIVEVELGRAMMLSELSRLGDRSVATTGPFWLRLVVDAEKMQPIDPQGRAEATFCRSELYRADTLLETPEDQATAWVLIEHGEWEGLPAEYVIEDGRLVSVDFLWQPHEPSGQGFDHIGLLSRIFARYYAGLTVKDGAVIQLQAPARPDWFRPFLRDANRSAAMPMWIFEIRPNEAALSDAA